MRLIEGAHKNPAELPASRLNSGAGTEKRLLNHPDDNLRVREVK
jgi:hypothetical protein